MVRSAFEEDHCDCTWQEDGEKETKGPEAREEAMAQLQRDRYWRRASGRCDGCTWTRSRPGSPRQKGRAAGHGRGREVGQPASLPIPSCWQSLKDQTENPRLGEWASGLAEEPSHSFSQQGARGSFGMERNLGHSAGATSRQSCPLPCLALSDTCSLVLVTHLLLFPEHPSSLPPKFSLPLATLLLVFQKTEVFVYSLIQHLLSSSSELKISVILVIPNPVLGMREGGAALGLVGSKAPKLVKVWEWNLVCGI